MAIDPAAGKILGMLMAYAVSSLGLLLALSLIHISEPTRQVLVSRMPSSA